MPVRTTVLLAAVLTLSGCSQVRWVAITTATATDPSATSLAINIDGCADVPDPQVVESSTEVRLLIDLKLDYGGVMPACMGGAIVHLTHPIGTRKIVDDRRNQTIPITWSPITPPVHLAGSVNELLGKEADATVTAWLLVDRSGVAVLCDDLPIVATACPTPTISVDWATSGTARPTDLLPRGDVMVSVGPITLHGSLKIDILYVGTTP
jgi:hypothetical protein